MDESDRKQAAAKCDNCLCWHKYCKAECCWQHYFTLPEGFDTTKLRYGYLLKLLHKPLSPDMIWYLELHGVKYAHGYIITRLKNFELKDGKLWLYNRCHYLTDDLKCSGHPTDKPKVCQDLKEGCTEDPRFIITPNCLFRYKK